MMFLTNPRIILLVGLLTDLVLTVFLATMIDEIGILIFIIMVMFLFGGTIVFYTLMKRKQGV
ncbi:hypothetical protein FZW96_00960 [Bacillus sp. BGMRC 2118]|nr:hypothetical protein FZW96_00960 [Bacillus sp. BGMRC 2118]